MEIYSRKIICTNLLFTFLSYFFGTIVIYSLNSIAGIFYAIFCILTIFLSLKLRCTYCFYYGKRCGFGFGILSKVFFSQGESKEFNNPKNVIPVLLFSLVTSLLPLIVGVTLLIVNFSILHLVYFILYILFGVIPNFFIRSKSCAKCEQGKLGCPAYDKKFQ
ncbi:hypothetical protein DSAG12_00101 [Promethearchaeum syntrophicum]|uniref:Uncharacterized protein n=1 Tax=Promethearchaeum syntrophicum TaxID=2594042 RepID=A0A5B9D631_9ARCH|nr:hypothetical protein [Candidatus Prometheoarchaeum syntrophicum]QEE14290.1 hypothetical protein DSAG12_00101 [Candidatus Prometheoarchaeum syntrophicum]